MKKTLVSLAIALAVAAGSAHAERAKHRQSYTVDRVHTNASGQVRSSHMEQRVTDNGFTRSLQKTRPDGKTATRDTVVANDAENGIRTRTVEGATFGGKAYSGESVTTRTDNGYTREGVFTGPNGGTSTRSVDATVDKQAGTFTKEVSVTRPNGDTSTTTVVKQRIE